MEKISPQPRLYSRSLSQGISYETNWVNWKSGGCLSYELERQEFVDQIETLFNPEESLACNPDFMGNEDLTKLWKKGDSFHDDLVKKGKG